jgi:hypothetical protein
VHPALTVLELDLHSSAGLIIHSECVEEAHGGCFIDSG